MKVFAISDQHYGHENIIKYCHRKAPNAFEDMKAMVLAHNETVKDGDLVIFVGDVACSQQGRDWLPKILKALKGRKILVRGNHDHFTNEEFKAMGFERVEDILVAGDYVFCHYPDNPKAVNIAMTKGLKLVCGHTHKPFPKHNYGDNVERVNVAVDVMGLKPMELFEVLKS